ncbi:MAG: class I SAM-dependent methyltransferase [Actinomycetota bacterium]|nr:class I SAM-dependent methyltransferase [Actinomycetota bacterium]
MSGRRQGVRPLLRRIVPRPARRALWAATYGAQELQQRAFEKRLGVSTSGHVYFEGETGLQGENAFYEGCQWLPVRRALRSLDPGPHDVFADLGSGKGQALLIAGRLPYGRVIGVDLMDELTRDANANIAQARPRLRAGHVEAVTADVLEWPVPDDLSVVFLFSPFLGEVFDGAMRRIFDSYDRNPRRLHIVYDYPWEHNRLLATGRVVLVDVLPSQWPARPWWWRTGNAIPIYRVVGEGERRPAVPALRRRLFRPRRAIEQWSGPNDRRYTLERDGVVVLTNQPGPQKVV